MSSKSEAFEQALVLTSIVIHEHPLEPVRGGGPLFVIPPTSTPAEQRIDLAITVADWLLDSES